MTAQPLFTQFQLKELPGLPERIANAVYYIKADGAETVSLYVTDRNGEAYPLADVATERIDALASQMSAILAGANSSVDTFIEAYNRFLTDESAAAALTTTVAGKLAKSSNLSDLTDVSAAQTNLGLSSWLATQVGSVVQAYNAGLAAIAGLTTTTFGRSLLTLADKAALRTATDLPTSTTVGRLARYTGTAGEQGQSAASEDGSGNVTLAGGLYASGRSRIQPASAAVFDVWKGGSFATGFSIGVDDGGSLVVGASSGEAVFRWGSGKLYFANAGGTAGMWLDQSGNAYVGGNVGIGTTAPGELLDVRGNSGANKGVLVKNDGAGRAILRLDSGGTSTTDMFFALGGVDKWSLQANDSYNFAIIDNTVAAHRFLVDTSGNVGIGTTAPTDKLHVNGGLKVSNGSISVADGWALASGVAGGSFYFDVGTAIFRNGNGAAAGAILKAAGGLNIGTSSFSLATPPAGGAIIEGNVGIGTTDPSKLLSLASSEPAIQLTSGAAGGQWQLVAGNGVGVTAGDFVLVNSGYGNTPIRIVNDAGNLNNNALVIRSGNVGIGTPAPAEKFHVAGAARVSGGYGNGSAWDGSLTIGGVGGVGADLGSVVWGDGTGYKLHFGPKPSGGAFAPKITFVDNGNVGIGTAAPETALHVYGSYDLPGVYGFTRELLKLQSTDTPGVGVGAVLGLGGRSGLGIDPYSWAFVQGAQDVAARYAGRLSFWTTSNGNNSEAYSANYQRMVINSDGNVGIGTASPSQKLHVAGQQVVVQHEYGALSFWKDAAPSKAGQVSFNSATSDGLSFNLFDGATWSTKMVVDANGNVGIGTASPTDLLDVNSDAMRLRSSKTPASSSAAGNAGEMCWDSSYLYICTATNTWRRIAHATW